MKKQFLKKFSICILSAYAGICYAIEPSGARPISENTHSDFEIIIPLTILGIFVVGYIALKVGIFFEGYKKETNTHQSSSKQKWQNNPFAHKVVDGRIEEIKEITQQKSIRSSTYQKKSIAELHQLATNGDAQAQYFLGEYYSKDNIPGPLTVRSTKPSYVDWYRKSAEQGFPLAQVKMGSCYQYGMGVIKDESKALEWYHKAAIQGNAQAQMILGSIYFNGECGVTKNKEKGILWFRKSAEKGNTVAQFLLKNL